ncbi:MAG: cytidylate kinase-like family protein [Ilumatobacteraceae bacterium]
MTISATYGAGGSVIAPRLAAVLGLAFDDRVISPPTAATLESLTDEERESTPPSRWLSALARVAAMVPAAPVPLEGDADPVTDLRRRNEEHLGAALAAGSTLFLGRAAAIALAKRTDAYHIRLNGPANRRIARAMAIEETSLDEATARCTATDKARDHFVRRLYNADPGNPAFYHLVLDTTVLSTDAAVDVLSTAVEHFWERQGFAT